MNIYRLVILALVFLGSLVFDILWAPYVPWLHLSINATLITVIALTIGERPLIGLTAAVFGGVVYSLFSAVSGPSYLIAFIMAVSASWVFSKKIVTTRSAVSFISTVVVGTVSYAVTLIVAELLLSLINQERLQLDILTIGTGGILQALAHPILLSISWRLFGRHQYHRLSTMTTHQSF